MTFSLAIDLLRFFRVPIQSPRQRARLDEIIRTALYDEHLAWELQGETWTPVNGDPEKDTHEIFEKVYEGQVMTKTAKKKKWVFDTGYGKASVLVRTRLTMRWFFLQVALCRR